MKHPSFFYVKPVVRVFLYMERHEVSPRFSITKCQIMCEKIRATIVIVDDHTLTRKTLSCRFTSLGYKVLEEAENGKECIDKMKTCPAPDICLLGINRPEISGLETAVRMKKEWPGIKILFFSTPHSDAYTDKLKEIGVDGFVSKHAPFSELNTALLNMMKKMPATQWTYSGVDAAV